MPNKELTIVMVSFYSEKMIERAISKLPKNYQIIITDNARTKLLKKNIEKKFFNARVVIPSSNLGNGDGINFALKKIKTKYALYLDVDTLVEKKTINKILHVAKNNKNWSIIAPNIRKYKYRDADYKSKRLINDCYEMNFVEGCALLFDTDVMKKIGYYDKKIFLYYEENDLFLRIAKKNKKILLLKNAFISHVGNSSVDKKYKQEIEINRNWHYMWSKFYFYKKHYSSTQAYKKTIAHFFKSIFKFSIFYFFDKKKFTTYQARASGLFHSYINNSSWRRPNIS
tara:strand:- start:2902 stop:3753 length:852 start_codon:yes stop_codon:yes gene_type:complete